MTDTDSRPPDCILCGKPGLMGVGRIGTNPDAWYCREHLGAGYVHGAQPVDADPRRTPIDTGLGLLASAGLAAVVIVAIVCLVIAATT